MLNDCRPVLFIGSSGKRLDIAEALGELLTDVSEPHVWNDGAFLPGEGTLEALERLAVEADFAVMVATPDDLVERRGEPARMMPRDNILFELGLFIGALGRKRTFICTPDPTFLPADLLGITVCLFSLFSDPPDVNLADALADAAEKIKHQVEKLGFRAENSGRLLEGWWKYSSTTADGGHKWGGTGEILVDPTDPTKVTMTGTRTWNRKGEAPRKPITACGWDITRLVFGRKYGRLTVRFDHSIRLPTGATQGSCELEIDKQFNRMKGYFYYHAPNIEFGRITFSRTAPPARQSRAIAKPL
jgi:hypothetical protein